MYVAEGRKRKGWEDRRRHHLADKWRGSEEKGDAKKVRIKKIPQNERDLRRKGERKESDQIFLQREHSNKTIVYNSRKCDGA